jgi:hypothetical protein
MGRYLQWIYPTLVCTAKDWFLKYRYKTFNINILMFNSCKYLYVCYILYFKSLLFLATRGIVHYGINVTFDPTSHLEP